MDLRKMCPLPTHSHWFGTLVSPVMQKSYVRHTWLDALVQICGIQVKSSQQTALWFFLDQSYIICSQSIQSIHLEGYTHTPQHNTHTQHPQHTGRPQASHDNMYTISIETIRQFSFYSCCSWKHSCSVPIVATREFQNKRLLCSQAVNQKGKKKDSCGP